jgi:hypothetical protein
MEQDWSKGANSSNPSLKKSPIRVDQRAPNRPAYRSNLEETKELRRQVNELMIKGYIHESMSPCTVPVLLVPKNDETWRMCVGCRIINNITIKYRH